MIKEIWKKAETIKEISGHCIKTIPIGTQFKVLTVVIDAFRNTTNDFTHCDSGYRSCRHLDFPNNNESFGITSIWLDEFKIIE